MNTIITLSILLFIISSPILMIIGIVVLIVKTNLKTSPKNQYKRNQQYKRKAKIYKFSNEKYKPINKNTKHKDHTKGHIEAMWDEIK